MSAPRRLWLVRHARPLIDAGVCYGASDLPADEADTQRAALSLAPRLPAAARLFMSGLGRAQQLAHALHALRPELAPPLPDYRLNEMDFGCHELERWDAIDRAAYDAWSADFHAHRFGGRESVAELLRRVAQALREAEHAACLGIDPVWVTHAGVIRAAQYLQAHPGRVPQAGDWPAQAPGFGGWICLELQISA